MVILVRLFQTRQPIIFHQLPCSFYTRLLSSRTKKRGGQPLLPGKRPRLSSRTMITDLSYSLEATWNVMAHAQKPNFVFRRNGRVHLNRRGRQFSRLLAAEVCALAFIVGSNAGYTMFRGGVKGTGYPLHSPVSPSLPLPYVTVCRHISTGVCQLRDCYYSYSIVVLLDFYCLQEGIHSVTEESAILREKFLSIKIDRYNETCLFAKSERLKQWF
jgi:hypothetical protein